jgi:hypothetical protein
MHDMAIAGTTVRATFKRVIFRRAAMVRFGTNGACGAPMYGSGQNYSTSLRFGGFIDPLQHTGRDRAPSVAVHDGRDDLIGTQPRADTMAINLQRSFLQSGGPVLHYGQWFAGVSLRRERSQYPLAVGGYVEAA